MSDDDLSQQPEDWKGIGAQIAAGAFPNLSADGVADVVTNGIVKGLAATLDYIRKAGLPLATGAGKLLTDLEEPILPIFAAFIAPIVSNMFGTPQDVESFSSRSNREGRGEAARAIVDAFSDALTGDGPTGSEPSDEGAKRIAGAAVHAVLEGWFNGLIPEVLGELIPLDWLHFKDLTALSDEIIRALGVGRLVRRAFAPLVDATAATPMQWYVHKAYRQTLFSASEAAQLFARGLYTDAELDDELGRQGWSAERISLLKLLNQKFLSADDAMTLVRHGVLDRSNAIEALQNQGYDAATAERIVSSTELKRLDAINDDATSAIRAAYIDRRIDDTVMGSMLESIYPDDNERAAYVTAFTAIRDLNSKRITASQAEACVKAGVLAIADYRNALRLEGYDEDAVLALELLLETELNHDANVEKLRQQKQQELAAEKQAKADAAAKKQQELDAQRALARRGSLADLRRAVVTGLIPVSRYADVLAPQYDADTVQILVDQVNADRAAYVAAQQKAADATKRAALKSLSVGQYQQAVYDGVLTLDQFRAALQNAQLADADINILVATTQQRAADLKAAADKRAAAEAAAKVKHIDLSAFELLVRRGHRSIADYQAMLQSLGYDDASIAALVDLLTLKIADDTAARQQRAALTKANDPRGLSLDQIRRAVILGISSLDDFQRWLVNNHFAPDAQVVLLDELRADVDEAEAARKKRNTPPAAGSAARLPIATAAKAVRLGILTPADYQQRLADAGYSADDIAVELDLLTTEIADAKAKADAAAAAKASTPDRGLSLDQLAAAVKRDEATIADYRARAASLGFSDADVQTLVDTLADQLDVLKAAAKRRTEIDTELHARNLSLGDLERQVTAGAVTLDAYRAQLATWGYSSDDADLLASLVDVKRAG